MPTGSTTRLLAACAHTVATACSGQPSTGPSAPPTTSATAPAPTTIAAPPTTTGPAPTVAPTTVPGPSGPRGPARCAETRGWTTEADTASGSTTDELYQVRVGRHDCYDRVVFDINGPADVGFDVRYVPTVHSEGKGDPLPVAGDAVLQVVVRAPEQGAGDGGHQPGRVLATTGEYFFTARQLTGWTSLRAVRFAGFFEGQCTFAIGVRERLPLRAFTLLDRRDQIQRVVVDIAHR